MENLTTFLANHYLLFILLGLISFFALVGYFVDQNEQKRGISKINKSKEEKDIHDLAKEAANKSLSNAITDAAKKSNTSGIQNTIMDLSGQDNNTLVQGQSSPVGFDVLNK